MKKANRFGLRYANLVLASFLLRPTSLLTDAAVPCNSTHNPCEELLYKGSQCKDGFCTNPFQGGCLRSILQEEKYAERYGSKPSNSSETTYNQKLDLLRRYLISTPRVCNSEDSPDAAERGICVDNMSENGNNFDEVRILPQNWESTISSSWLLQIIYSELVGVPSTLETGFPDTSVNFYDETNRMYYGTVYHDCEMLKNAYDAEEGKCATYREKNRDATEEDYVSCAHVVMEVWHETPALLDFQKSGIIGPTHYYGAVGMLNWYVTRFSVSDDPALGTFRGYQGEKNRQKLAERFKRPTTFKDFCTSVSPTNCTNDITGISSRPPATDGSEDGKFFIPGIYNGHFRATEKNDCNKTKDCTGHYVDFPCDWTGYFNQQAHHLKISLDSDMFSFGTDGLLSHGGYTYDEMVEIWYAANATKSDLIGYWWQPDATFSSLFGTDSEMVVVTLPPPTQECEENRIDFEYRCKENATEYDLYGNAKGACALNTVVFQKVAVNNMVSNIKENILPRAKMSPAYDIFRDFKITELQLEEILHAWVSRGHDKYGFDLRFETCRWLADNLDVFYSIIPESHPRTFDSTASMTHSAIAALVLSSATVFLTICTACSIVYKQLSNHTVDKIAQIEFVLLLLGGLFLVSMGALLLAVRPSSGTCISSMWMINVGYTLELVPLLVKVSAVIKVVKSARRLKRMQVNKKMLLTRSLGLSSIAAVFCAVWTGLDPPKPQEDLEVTSETSDLGETYVLASYYCNSESQVWYIISFLWQGLLLVVAIVLAYQMRSTPNSVNDSAALALMIYSSSIFMILRIIMSALMGSSNVSDSLEPANLQNASSILCSLDTIANIIIYFRQFFLKKENERERSTIFHSTFRISGLRGSRLRSGDPSVVVTADRKVIDEEKSQHTSSIRFSDPVEEARKSNNGYENKQRQKWMEGEDGLPDWVIEKFSLTKVE